MPLMERAFRFTFDDAVCRKGQTTPGRVAEGAGKGDWVLAPILLWNLLVRRFPSIVLFVNV